MQDDNYTEEQEQPPEAPDGQLGDWLDQIPEEVQNAGEKYATAREAFNRAKSQMDGAKEVLIDTMEEHGVKRFPFRDGQKVFELDESTTVKIKKRTVDGTDDSQGATALD
jgi:hypothetical protein